MTEIPSAANRPEVSPGKPDLLDSWKTIAAYLNRDIRTAQRWEKTLQLPVHRVANSKLVFAYRSELDAWLSQQQLIPVNAPPMGPTTTAAGVPTDPEHRRPRLNRSVWAGALVLLLAIAVWIAWRAVGWGAVDSIAVLPFVNVGADPNTEYLSDGLTENLINSLSQLPGLRVSPRSLVFAYKGRERDPRKAGRELNVRAVLMGRVIESGDTLNIQVELVDVGEVAQLWGRQYNRKLSEMVHVSQEIAADLSGKLHLKSTAEQQRRLAKRSTENSEAYQAYLKGRYYWNRRTERTLKRAVEYFQRAIDLDSRYALAYAALADCYIVYSEYEVEPPHESGLKAKAAALKALEIDSALAEAHASLAFSEMQYEWDWAAAEREFQRSIELDPDYAVSQEWYSIYLESVGRTEQAVAAARRAQQLDPVSLIISAQLAQALFFSRRYDEAIEQAQKVLDMDPNFPRGHFFLALAYEQKRMYGEALAEFQKAVKLSEGSPNALGALGHSYAVAGKRAQALQVLADLSELSKSRYVAPFDTAVIYTALGDKGPAFEWLAKALDDRSSRMKLLNVDPRFDSLRIDARFTGLLRRMGLNP